VPLENETNAELILESLSIGQVGEYTAKFSYSGGISVVSEPTYLDAKKQEQSIRWNTLSEVVLGDPALPVQATASSGLEVMIEIVDGGAIFDGKALRPKEGGRIRLKATQLGNEFYNSAPETFHTIDVLLRPNISAGDGGVVLQTLPSEAFTSGQVLLLIAIPDQGFVFSSWHGDLASTDNPLNLTILDNVSVFATFKRLWPLLIDQVEGGRIAIRPEQEEIADGSILSILALPNKGFRFDHWLGSLSGNSRAATLIVSEATSISAVFVEHRAPEILSNLIEHHLRVGEDFTFEPDVGGTSPVSFQWSKDGKKLPSATDAALSIPGAQSADSGIYSLLAINEAGETRLDLVDLEVLRPIVLVNQSSEIEKMAKSRVVLEVELDGDGPMSLS